MTAALVFHEAGDGQNMRIALTADPETVRRFRSAAFHHLGAAPRGMTKPYGVPDSKWFLQCDSAQYLLFEFWTSDRAAIKAGIARTLSACTADGLDLTLTPG